MRAPRVCVQVCEYVYVSLSELYAIVSRAYITGGSGAGASAVPPQQGTQSFRVYIDHIARVERNNVWKWRATAHLVASANVWF